MKTMAVNGAGDIVLPGVDEGRCYVRSGLLVRCWGERGSGRNVYFIQMFSPDGTLVGEREGISSNVAFTAITKYLGLRRRGI